MPATDTDVNQYYGARWVRVDFHLHSPGAFSFKHPNGINLGKDQPKIIARYVQQLVDQDIRIAAITDYQGIRSEWFLPIQKAAQDCNIVVYPGVELSFKLGKHGLHILAVFPSDIAPETINMAVQALDTKPHEPLIGQDGKHRDIDLAKNIKEALISFRQSTQAVLIPAHPNNDDGLFKSCSSRDAAEIIHTVRFDAIESFSNAEQKKMVSTGVLTREAVEQIASVEFSDAHAIEEIGTKTHPDETRRATFLKLSILDDLRAIRLAMRDPQILVKTGEKPISHYTHFESLNVDGNGFLGGLSLLFSPEMNVLVGGRGVGKSAILETIRYVLDAPPYSPTDYRESSVQHALGSGGKAVIFAEQQIGENVRRHYRFERVWGETPKVFELAPEREVQLSPLEVLGDQEGPLYFGQREIYEVTRQEPQRLRLLDTIIGRHAVSQLLKVKKLEDQLQDNSQSILEKRRMLGEREEIEQRLKEINHKIELYRRYGIAEKLKEATTLASDEQRLNNAIDSVSDAIPDWSEVGGYWRTRWDSIREQLSNAESSQKDILNESSHVFAELQKQVDGLFQQGESHLQSASQTLQHLSKQWQEKRKPLDEDIRKIKKKLGEENLDPDELIQLATEQTRMEPQLNALGKVQFDLEQLEQSRRKLLHELSEARREVWKMREKQAKLINDKLRDRIHVEVIYKGQRAEFLDRLTSFFQGSGVDRKSLERITQSESEFDGIHISEKIMEGAAAVESTYGISSRRAQQILGYLDESGRLFELQLLAPDDAVQISLKVNETFHPLKKLSDGQRATAMLLLLLAQEERLLIVDQPEDDLDNRFVYEDIVRILRDQKGKRQLMAATHNPNIPVLGHAELILALEAPEDHCNVAAQAAIDCREVQEFVRNVMEGGEEAFQRRAQKYGWS
ncbi:MAG: AAA family ATPase [Anaerolineales bacterium]|nr:AAA family ATPase [Anaerolineales bacterium]